MFSKDSRWDRRIPTSVKNEETIDVAAVFRRGRLIPKWFVYKSRRYQVKEVTYYWQDKNGTEVFHYFALSDGVNLYQVYLNNTYMSWRLVKTCPL